MKKLRKIVTWILGILIALVLLAMIGLKLFFPTEKVRALAEEQGSAALNRPVKIEGLDVSFWGGIGVVLKNVSIGSPADFANENLVQAEQIDVKLQILPLLIGDYRVDRLIVDRPHISLHKTAAGVVNYAIDLAQVDTTLPPEVTRMPGEQQTAATVVSFDRLQIKDGQLHYRDDSARVTIELTGFNLTTSLTTPSERTYQSAGHLAADSIRIATNGEAFPPYEFDLNYRASYDMVRQELTVDRGDIRLNTLKLSVTGIVAHLPDSAQARLAVKTSEVAVSDVFSLLPPSQRENLRDFTIGGSFALTVDLEYFADRADNPLTYTGTAVMTDMSMSSKDIPGELKLGRALMDFKPDNLRIALEQATFDNKPLRGHLVVDYFENPRVSGELAGDVDLKFAEPFLPAEHNQTLSGRSRFEITFNGPAKDPTAFDFSGNLSVTDGQYSSDLLPEPVTSFSLDIYVDRGLVNVRSLKGAFPSGELTFSGRINDLVPYLLADSVSVRKISPEIDGSLKGQFSLAMANALLPERGSPSMSGRAAMDLQFSGSMTDLTRFKPRGTLTISEASYTDSLLPEPITYLGAGLKVSPDTITVDSLRMRFESSDLHFSGKLIKPFPYLLPIDSLDRSTLRRPMFLFELSSQHLDIDRLFPEAVPGSADSAESDTSIDSVSVVFVPDIDGQGSLAVDTLIYNKMEFTRATGIVRIRDRKIHVTDIVAKLYTGDVTGETVVDLNDFENPLYTGSFKFSQIEANDFLERFTPFGGYLFGKMDFTGNYSATGWEPEQFLKSMTLDGLGEMREARLVTTGAVYAIGRKLAEAVHESFEEEQSLKNLASKIRVENGRVVADNLTTRIDKFGDVSLGGSYGFDGGIDYNGKITLSEAATRKAMSGLGKTLSGLLGGSSVDRLTLPFNMGGSIDKPDFDLDLSPLTKKAGENLLKEGADQLKGLIKKGGG
ncbi:MAG: AsmA family protein [candidate division Zixibacteria bacterium]|nr:AsmA family protein [candidate division Zixibacteria bacterium]